MRSFFIRSAYTKILIVASAGLVALGCAAFAVGFQSIDDVLGFALRDAAENGNLARVKSLLKDRPNLVFSKSNRGWTPLYWAVVSGHKDVAEVLLANNADVNVKNDGGYTPLHLAASNGDNGMAEFLLAHGADINAKDNGGGTPLRGAKAPVVELLLAHGANVDARDNEGATPLFGASADIARLLLAHGADVNAQDHFFGARPQGSGGVAASPRCRYQRQERPWRYAPAPGGNDGLRRRGQTSSGQQCRCKC
jgi:hypothetical protein